MKMSGLMQINYLLTRYNPCAEHALRQPADKEIAALHNIDYYQS